MRVNDLPVTATNYHRSVEMLIDIGAVERPDIPECRVIGHKDNQNVSKFLLGLRITE